ncbi:hypothetical protein FRC10_002411, partial [Ceratobasidium sp. 414]
VVTGVLVNEKTVQAGTFDRMAKLHMLSHYTDNIHELGMPNGYSTETAEHLHIIYVKIPWCMSNHWHPFPQMVKYVQCLEVMQIQHTVINELYGKCEVADKAEIETVRNFIKEEDDDEGEGVGEGGVSVNEDSFGTKEDSDEEQVQLESVELVIPPQLTYYPQPSITIAQVPTVQHMPGHVLISSYCAPDLIRAVRSFLSCKAGRTPILLPSDQFDIWHKATLNHPPLPFAPGQPCHWDVVHVHPVARDTAGHVRDTGLFDTALVATSRDGFGITCKYQISPLCWHTC